MDNLLNKHHPAPWRVVEPAKWPWHIGIVDAAGDFVQQLEMPCCCTSDKKLADVLAGECWDDETDRQRAVEANAAQMQKARRIVACVNALKEYDTEDLEYCNERGLNPLVGNLFSSRMKLLRQRDDLLTALKDARRALAAAAERNTIFDEAYQKADAAIASVEGDK